MHLDAADYVPLKSLTPPLRPSPLPRQETCIILPRLKIAFDIGRCPQVTLATWQRSRPKARPCYWPWDFTLINPAPTHSNTQRSVYQSTVLITHGHLDHIGGLPCHASSR
jgi:ribonuclease BN (tRNA processing enzyme)